MTKSSNSLTVIQLNDSHAYIDLHQELFWPGACAANSFILPTHQVKALFASSGGYRNTDFLKPAAEWKGPVCDIQD